MRGFLTREIQAAVGHSLAGGQALHLHTLGVGKDAPAVFKAAVARGEWVAHLFDKDTDRLRRTAAALGVNVVVIDRPGQAAQHIDICCGPLARAMLLCDNAATLPNKPGDPRPLETYPEFEAQYQQTRPDWSEFGLPAHLMDGTPGANYAAAYEADRAARPNPPPRPKARPPEEMRFGNMGTMAKPAFPETGADDGE